MRGVGDSDRTACRERNHNLFNTSQRHTRCEKYCIKNGCRYGIPTIRNDDVAIRAHPLVGVLILNASVIGKLS